MFVQKDLVFVFWGRFAKMRVDPGPFLFIRRIYAPFGQTARCFSGSTSLFLSGNYFGARNYAIYGGSDYLFHVIL